MRIRNPNSPRFPIKDTVGSTPRGPRGPIAPPVNKDPSRGPRGPIAGPVKPRTPRPVKPGRPQGR